MTVMTPGSDEPLDVRTVTLENIEELAELTGRTKGELYREWCRVHPKELKILVGNPYARRT